LVAFGLLLALDSQWVLTLAQQPVLSQTYHIVYGRRGTTADSYYRIKTPGATFRSQTAYEQGEVLFLTKTAIFQQVLMHRPASAPVEESINNRDKTLYAPPQVIFLFFMWLAAVVGIWPGPVRRRTVDAAITAFLFAIINIYMLLRG
jgi:hypothetical protein